MKHRLLLPLVALALSPCTALRADTFTFTTDQSQITSGTNNQGWWTSNPVTLNDRTTNDNYITGLTTLFQTVQHRDFFTFDLSSLPAGLNITSVTLQIRSTSNYTGASNTLTLWDVSTDATSLSTNPLASRDAIYNDLGTGNSYGAFTVINGGGGGALEFTLSAAALRDVATHRGGYFSVGGDVPDGGSLFGSSNGLVQTLIITTAVSSTGVGDLPTGTFSSRVFALANGGGVAVGQGRDALNDSAMVWTPGGGMTSIAADNGSVGSEANGISPDGRYVTGSGLNGGIRTAYLYDRKTSTIQQLGAPAGYTSRSVGNAISADGTRIAGYAISSTGSYQPFLWTQSGGWQGLGWLPGSNNIGVAYAISSDGLTVVGDTTSANSGTSANEAFRWTNGSMTGLGDLAGGAFLSSARGVSGDGKVIVGSGTNANGQQAVRWVNGGAAETLGNLSGASGSIANAVSGSGDIIVGSSNSTAFVWDAKHGMRSLASVLNSEYGITFTNWTLTTANAISAVGDSVGGAGTNPSGNGEGWVAAINSRTNNYTTGQGYNGFHTSKLGGLGTSVDLLGGTAGGARSVFVNLLAMPTVQFAPGFASDVIDLSGTGSDTFVLRLDYDEATAISLYGSESKVQLGWFDTDNSLWKNAVLGNAGGVANFVGDRAYNSATDFVLGDWGIDTANNQAWAVVNHNSEFAVVPEPGSATLLLAGLAGFAARRRRR